MKILVTGSSGHLGEALIRVLKSQGQEVLGLDILASPFTDRVGSLADRAFVEDCMQGIGAVFHTATLHKPHIITHSKQDFINTNVTATLHLLEAAHAVGVQAFIFTSTTSTFGDAMTPSVGGPAIWVNEELVPIPKNIYGLSKRAAEDLCQLFSRNHNLPCLVLKTSRFFLEVDDLKEKRDSFADRNIKVNEYLNRRVDIADVVSAHLLALEKVSTLGFRKYIITATTPFTRADLAELPTNAAAVMARKFPDYEDLYARYSWQMPGIQRVYVNERARKELDWQPIYDYRKVLDSLRAGAEYRSPLAMEVGIKGYHPEPFDEGPYPV